MNGRARVCDKNSTSFLSSLVQFTAVSRIETETERERKSVWFCYRYRHRRCVGRFRLRRLDTQTHAHRTQHLSGYYRIHSLAFASQFYATYEKHELTLLLFMYSMPMPMACVIVVATVYRLDVVLCVRCDCARAHVCVCELRTYEKPGNDFAPEQQSRSFDKQQNVWKYHAV